MPVDDQTSRATASGRRDTSSDEPGHLVGRSGSIGMLLVQAAYTTSRRGLRVVRSVALSGESWRTETETFPSVASFLTGADLTGSALCSTGTSTPSMPS